MRRTMRWIATMVVLAMTGTACGEESVVGNRGPSTSTSVPTTSASVETTNTSPVPTTVQSTSTTDAAATTTTAPAALDPRDDALSDRSLLTLASDLPSSGTFAILPGSRSFIPRINGWFVTTEGGNVYTWLDIDTELVATEIDDLIATLTEPGKSNVLADGLAEHHRGDQYQLGIVSLLVAFGAGPGRSDVLQQILALAGDEPETDLSPLRDCIQAIEGYAVRGQQLIHDFAPRFAEPDENGVEAWTFPIDEFDAAIGTVEKADRCNETFSDTETDVRFGFERRSAGNGQEITMWVDRGIYLEPRQEVVMSVLVRSDPVVAAGPVQLDPAPLATMVNTFAVTIAECGELPWIYSNFAAGDSYYAPGSGGYDGPTWLDSDWLCEERVPEDRRP